MSWFPERSERSWLCRLCTRVLKTGPVPKHVAIIMDGNRRFAVKNSMAKAEGHLKGFDKLTETLEWCLDLGIREVTVYAFSIENFKRSKEEVDCLMELSRKKFARLMEEKGLLEKHGVCVRVLGDITLLPVDIQRTIAEAVLFTRSNTSATLNVCFSYTARDEMCVAMREAVSGIQLGQIRESDVSEPLLEGCLYTAPSGSPDLLIRTSGEVRLSDFLLWQSTYSVLSFVKVLWPDFSIWHLYAAVLHYQRNYHKVQEAIQSNKDYIQRLEMESDYNCVKAEMLKAEPALSVTDIHIDSASMQGRIEQYKKLRQERILTFLNSVHKKRMQFLESLAPNNNTFSKVTEPCG